MTTLLTEPQRNTIKNRDEDWLAKQLELIWQNHFDDIEKLNHVTIRWGRISRTRLGTITAKGGAIPFDNPEISEIRINPLLKHESIPESVIWQTIAHELTHYAHGFCSPHPRKFTHPHRGNVVQKELCSRNMQELYDEAQHWLKKHWHGHVAAAMGPNIAVRRRKRRSYGQRKHLSLLSHFGKTIKRRRRLGK